MQVNRCSRAGGGRGTPKCYDAGVQPAIDESQQMQAQAEKIRSSNVLGRSGQLTRLFEYLLEQSLAGQRPKELEIALAVFGKKADFDVSQDATIRVYIHKLRRKLEDHYSGAAAAGESVRIVIPKGEYRLTLEPALQQPQADVESAPTIAAPSGPGKKWLRWLAAVLVVSLIANAVLIATQVTTRQQAPAYAGVRDQAVWSRLLDDDLPIYLVLGDYYIFGETDQSMNVKRLIREFNINSPQDLQQEQYQNPELFDRYLDLDLSYLPIASAFALRNLMPILATANKRIEVVLASELSPQMLKSAHIVYIGYLSGMGMLRDLALGPSRFSIGETYDELVDSRTKRTYMSQAGVPINGEVLYHDYGFFSSFKGPNDNQILIVAGTRDIAVVQIAEALANPRTLAELSKSVGDAADFEALYEVSGIKRTGVKGRLLLSSPLDVRKSWINEEQPTQRTDSPP
jgi:hypothetical protein